VVAHGLGATVAQTRPLLSGVPGTKVFPVARGHGAGPSAGTYADLAGDLRAVADEHGATQALGVSLGAATLLRLLSETPDRLRRVVLFLPAALDQPVRRPEALIQALTARDAGQLEWLVRAELPGLVGPAVESYVAERVALLLTSQLLPLLSALDVPVPARGALGAVTADVLVVAQEGDPVHPVAVARAVVGALPRARLEVFEGPGVLFRERGRLRALVSAFLAGPTG
jgi:3-oxoadipate enol-lactonase